MHKARKAVIITSAVLLAASVIVFATASVLSGRGNAGHHIVMQEGIELTEGERIEFSPAESDLLTAAGFGHYFKINTGEERSDYILIPVVGYKPHQVSSSDSSEQDNFNVTAVVIPTTDQMRHDLADNLRSSAESLYASILEDYDEYVAYGYTEEQMQKIISGLEYRMSDEGQQDILNNTTAYSLQFADTSVYFSAKIISAAAGIVFLIVLIYAVLGIRIKGKHLVIGTVAVIITVVAATAFIFRKDISTMMSLREFCPGLYMARIDNDYKLDNMLEYEINSEATMLNAISQELFFGVPLSVDLEGFGCSAFSAETPEGTHIMGRNFDLGDTDGTIIYTAPENGYRSIGICDMSVLNLAGEYRMADVVSPMGRVMSRAFPLITFDGMNEAGLGISILSLDYHPSHPQTDKHDVYILVAIRAILDTCATVDEAMAFLEANDIHSMAVYNYHLFITDRSGNSAVAEWVDNEMYIIDTEYVTNFYLADPDDPRDCDRYDTLEETITSCGDVMTIEEAMELLDDVQQEGFTQWSCVYDLDNFTVYVVSETDYDNVHVVTPESFDN